MSTIARTAAGTPVASTTTGGPPGPAQLRAPADDVVADRSSAASVLQARGSLQPALLEVDHHHLGAALERHQTDALSDRPGTEHDQLLTGRDAAPADRADGDRHRLDHRRERAVCGGDRKHLLLADTQQLLKPAVDVDPDQLEVIAGIRAPDRAGVAVAARAQRATAPPADRPRARRGSPGRERRSWRATSCPCTRGNCAPPAASESSPAKKW